VTGLVEEPAPDLLEVGNGRVGLDVVAE